MKRAFHFLFAKVAFSVEVFVDAHAFSLGLDLLTALVALAVAVGVHALCAGLLFGRLGLKSRSADVAASVEVSIVMNDLHSKAAFRAVANSVVIDVGMEYRKLNLTAVGIAFTVVVIVLVGCAVYRDFLTAGIANAVAVKILMHRAGLGRGTEKLGTGEKRKNERKKRC